MKRIGCVLFCVCVAGAVAGSAGAQAPAGPKVFVSVDMEGIWGVVHGEQVNPGSPEYANARRWMAEDANAVVAGLFEAGAGEVIVNDSHGGMRNIVADTLDPRASLVSGSPKPFGMMQGIDASYQAAVFVGYHARAGSAPAILDHTIASATIRGIRVNGQELPELGLNAALAGYHKVPVILLTGDTETCSQARSVLGAGLTTAAVKEAIGRTAARMYPAGVARARLKEAAKAALAGRAAAQPFRIEGPYTFEVDFLNSAQAELPSGLPGVRRTSPRSVSFTSGDYLEGFRLLRAIISLASS
ncbi:MAG: D-aminopeptidase [Acidobacteria bacterium]|nr:D-aminopeptidase [Acidobacteriota bacterium]